MSTEFDPERHVDAYRRVMESLDREPTGPGRAELQGIAERLRKEWAAWNGGDAHELHEVAFGG
jgi:hypothetical protein